MKVKILLLTITAGLIINYTPLFAETSGEGLINLDYNRESEQVSPRYELKINWNKTQSSDINYYSRKDISVSGIEGYDESKDALEKNTTSVKILLFDQFLGNSSAGFRIGFGGEYRFIKKDEFGYFRLPASLGSTWVNFDNRIEIKAFMPEITAGFDIVDTSAFSFNTRVRIIPAYFLSVKQKTLFMPIVNEEGTIDSGSWQNPCGELEQKIYLKSSSILFFDIALYGNLSTWTNNYDIQTLRYSSGSFIFREATIKKSYHDLSVAISLVFPALGMEGMAPYAGIGYEWSYVSDSPSKKGKKDQSDFLFNFGFRKILN